MSLIPYGQYRGSIHGSFFFFFLSLPSFHAFVTGGESGIYLSADAAMKRTENASGSGGIFFFR